MSRYHAYLNSALRFIERYDGSSPLTPALKKFFAANRKYGSADRREISGLCFNYYRLGKALRQTDPENWLLTGTQLCLMADPKRFAGKATGFHQSPLISNRPVLAPEVVEEIITTLFPYHKHTTPDFDNTGYARSILVQPDVFARIRKDALIDSVCRRLDAEDLEYTINGKCLRFAPNLALDQLMEIDREVVVQDLNSQKVFDDLVNNGSFTNNPKDRSLKVWDCCAGSGGKSILLYDLLGKNIELTVSDIRNKMRPALEERFAKAGIINYHWLTTDLSQEKPVFPEGRFDIILCDVPCTGSGTWARNPEQLYFFNEAVIETYSILQQQIVANAIQRLKTDGLLLYVTCSVFSGENEINTAAFTRELSLELIGQKLLYGGTIKSDSLFTAILQKKA